MVTKRFKNVDGTKIVAILIALVVATSLATIISLYAFWQQVERNRDVIAQVDALNDKLADEAYTECVSRNTRAKESMKALEKLAAAHRGDGNPKSAAIWQEYLEQSRKNPLPSCKKPNDDL